MLIQQLGDRDVVIQSQASQKLIDMGADVAPLLLTLLEALDRLEVLDSNNLQILLSVMNILGKIGKNDSSVTDDIRSGIVKLLDNKNMGIRRFAISILGRLGETDENTVAILKEILINHRDDMFRRSAYDALVNINTEGARQAIIASDNATAIREVIKGWGDALETENITRYMRLFWADGFHYISDDIEFDNIQQEREAISCFFGRFGDIMIRMSTPLPVKFISNTSATTGMYYEIIAFGAGGSLQQGFTGIYIADKSEVLLELRENEWSKAKEWRIVEWADKSRKDIRELIEAKKRGYEGKFLTTPGEIRDCKL